MRISDWSSDVCSSDLGLSASGEARRAGKEIVALKLGNSDLGQEATLAHSSHLSGTKQGYDAVFARYGVRQTDRKSVVSGQSVSVRVHLGGRRTIKNNNN